MLRRVGSGILGCRWTIVVVSKTWMWFLFRAGGKVGESGRSGGWAYAMGLFGVPDHDLQFLGRDKGLEAGVVWVVGLLEGGVAVLPGYVFGTWKELFEELILAAESYVEDSIADAVAYVAATVDDFDPGLGIVDGEELNVAILRLARCTLHDDMN